MKHTWRITIILLSMFIVAQFVGLAVISEYSPTQSIKVENNISLNYTSYNIPYGFEPPSDNAGMNLTSIIISFCIAIGVILLLMKYRVNFIMKTWFFLVITFALSITIFAFINSVTYANYIALGIALIITYFKVIKRDILVHNISEILIYPGIAALFVPIISIKTGIILLIIISIYDIYAVWHAKFMQKMAKYQMNTLKIFNGFLVPYKIPKEISKEMKGKKQKIAVAILGGGDIVFPIIISGVVLNAWGLLPALFITLFSSIALMLLFMFSEKGKFYPAMPFITAGCFVGLALGYLII